MPRRLFTSESVTEGHPDKIADQISDSILDAMLAQDPKSRVAVETMVTTGLVHIAGEVTTESYVEIPRLVRKVIAEGVGYDSSLMGHDHRPYRVRRGDALPADGPAAWGDYTHPDAARGPLAELDLLDNPASGLERPRAVPPVPSPSPVAETRPPGSSRP